MAHREEAREAEPRGTDKLCELRNVKVVAGDKTLLAIPELDVPSGVGLVGIIGPNGAGKSTLLKTLMGLVGEGDVRIMGRSAVQSVRAKKVGYLSQHESFELPLTLFEYVLLGCYPNMGWFTRPTEAIEMRAKSLLAEFDLGRLEKKRISSLSGGERQRAAIVRVMLQDAPLILMDEPTNHLDVRHQHLLMNFLGRAGDGRGIVMVLHDLNLAGNYADHVILMRDGGVIAQGAVDEVMTARTLSDAYNWELKRCEDEDGVYFVPARARDGHFAS